MFAAILPLLFSMSVSAQDASVKVNNIDTNSDQDTTISIKKGKNASDAEYTISEDTEDLAGDPAPLTKDARANWKKACTEWKKEFKEINKDNQIITLSCGSSSCTTTAMETICKSTAKSKVRVKVK